MRDAIKIGFLRRRSCSSRRRRSDASLGTTSDATVVRGHVEKPDNKKNPSLMEEDWVMLCQALYRSIRDEEWHEILEKLKEVPNKFGVKNSLASGRIGANQDLHRVRDEQCVDFRLRKNKVDQPPALFTDSNLETSSLATAVRTADPTTSILRTWT